jgi:hypothetical protein
MTISLHKVQQLFYIAVNKSVQFYEGQLMVSDQRSIFFASDNQETELQKRIFNYSILKMRSKSGF